MKRYNLGVVLVCFTVNTFFMITLVDQAVYYTLSEWLDIKFNGTFYMK